MHFESGLTAQGYQVSNQTRTRVNHHMAEHRVNLELQMQGPRFQGKLG